MPFDLQEFKFSKGIIISQLTVSQMLKGGIKKRELKWIFPVSFMAVFIILGIFQVKISNSVKVRGKLLPAKEWIVKKEQDSRLIALLYNYHLRTTESISVFQFDRGDEISFVLNSSILDKRTISAGDTVGFYKSYNLEGEIVRLRSDLQVAEATLNLYTAGEKEPVIKEAEQRIVYAKTEKKEQERIANRQDSLFKKNLISREEFELAKARAELYDINIQIANAQLRSLQTGSKKEQIDLLNTQIEALETEICVLKRRIDNLILVSPINGQMVKFFSNDTLLIVRDTSNYVIAMPVKWLSMERVSLQQNVEISARVPAFSFKGKVSNISQTTQLLNGEQIVWTTATVSNIPDQVLSGMIVDCSILCEPVTLLKYLDYLIKSTI